jgi:hypothetical protein
MQNKRGRQACLTVDEQHKHLAIARLQTVMGTGAISNGSARIMQVKGSQDAQPGTRKRIGQPVQSLIA